MAITQRRYGLTGQTYGSFENKSNLFEGSGDLALPTAGLASDAGIDNGVDGYPQVVGIASGSGAVSTQHVIDLGTFVADDWLMVFFVHDNGASPTLQESGWGIAGITSDVSHIGRFFFKRMDGTEGPTLTVDLSASRSAVWAVYRIFDTNETLTPYQVSVQSLAATANPNPPSLTTPWGAQKTLYISYAAWDSPDGVLVSYPSGYDSHQVTEHVSGANGIGFAVAARYLETDTENPGAFEISESGNTGASTIAILPLVLSNTANVSLNLPALEMTASADVEGGNGYTGYFTHCPTWETFDGELVETFDAELIEFSHICGIALPLPELIFDAQFTPPIYSVESDLELPAPSIVASGQMVPPVYEGTSDISLPTANVDASMLLLVPIVEASPELTLPSVEMLITAHIALPSMNASPALVLPAVTMSALGRIVGVPAGETAGVCTSVLSANIDTDLWSSGVCAQPVSANWEG